MVLDAPYPPDVRVRKEASSLAAAGHEVVLLCEHHGEPERRERIGPLEVVREPVYERFGSLSRPADGAHYLVTRVNRPWQRAIEILYDRTGFDVLHAHDLPLVRTALAWRGDRSVPVVADLHENWPEAVRQYRRRTTVSDLLADPGDALDRLATPVPRLKRLERRCVTGADRVVAVVEEGKAHYVTDCGADPENVYVAPNYVDPGEFGDRSVKPAEVDGEFVLLYVGTIGGQHRGLETVIRAMPAIAEDVADPRFLVVGSGPHRPALEALSRQCGVADRVEFTGWIAFENLPAYLAASDLGLVPHDDNPHTATTVPHKLTQYMAMGLAVGVSDVAPLARIVSDTGAGVVFPAGDPAGLADAAVGLAGDPDRLDHLGANGRRAVDGEYNWATAGRAIQALYADLAERAG